MPAVLGAFAWSVGACLVGPSVARWVEGSVSLGPKQAKVVTKFCFDYNGACNPSCLAGQHPGEVSIIITAARHSSGEEPRVHLALLDDEYFSFPEVSQVWDELNCSDVLKASKRSFPVNWHEAERPGGSRVETMVVEKIRPRWWYVAFVSCTAEPLEIRYKAHFVNKLRGVNQELSIDEPGVMVVFFLMLVFGAVAICQHQSVQRWREECLGAPEEALNVVSMITYLATVGTVGWFFYYWGASMNGQGATLWLLIGRGGVASAKTLLSTFLLMLAQGECVSTRGLAWGKHSEMVGGNIAFGMLSFFLELYGDSQFQSTTTEYIYDTRPGIALVAFDMFWLWVYASRALATFQLETRSRPRQFYRNVAPAFALWFASLPIIAFVATFIAPWYRLCVVFLVSSFVHATALAGLVWSLSPEVAPGLYDVGKSVSSTRLYGKGYDQELAGILSYGNGDL